MARIPILQGPAQLQTGNRTIRTAQPVAVTNAAVGQGLKNVGSTLFDISEKAKRANDVTNLTNASMEMQKAQMEFADFQLKNPNEADWLPQWQTINNRLKSDFDKMSLTPDARAQLQERLTSWSTRGTIQVQASAFKQAGQRMADAGQLAKQQAIQTNNPALYAENLADQQNAGFITPEQSALEYASMENALKAKRLGDLRTTEAELIRRGNAGEHEAWIELKGVYDEMHALGALDKRNHELALKNADDGEVESLVQLKTNGTNGTPVDLTAARKITDQSDLPPRKKEEIYRNIETARKNYANDDLISFAVRMASGEAIDGNDFNSQYMNAAELAEARAKINDVITVTPEQEASMYLDTMTMIDSVDPVLFRQRDTAEVIEAARVAHRIKKAPPHLRDQLATAFQAKMSGTDDKSAAADGAKLGREMLQQIVRGKEDEFFQGSGPDRKLKKEKVSEWMNFQQRVFNLEREVNRRIKGVDDIKKINEIVSDILSADYVSIKKRAMMPQPDSGFKGIPARGYEPAIPAQPTTEGLQIDPALFGTDIIRSIRGF